MLIEKVAVIVEKPNCSPCVYVHDTTEEAEKFIQEHKEKYNLKNEDYKTREVSVNI